jgi:tight adherence protein C
VSLTYLFAFAFGLFVSGAILTLLFGLRARARARGLDESRIYLSSNVLTLEQVEMDQPFADRVLRPAFSSLLRFLSRLTPKRNLEEIAHRLEVAGRPHGWGVADFVGLRLLSALLCGALSFFLLLLSDMSNIYRLLLTAVVTVLGFYLPILWLSWQVNQRKRQVTRALPDALDMLNICVGAGLGFDAALSRIGERWDNPLADEFNRVVTEIRLGKTRRQALLDLADRTDVPEMQNFVATIVQADQLGVSIAKVLRTQAEQMRIVRRQRAEELARQATIKLLFPLVFLIFPSMLAVLLGPAVPQLLKTLASLGQ